MNKLIQISLKLKHLQAGSYGTLIKRTFLSPAYYCQDVWDQRLSTPLIQKINLGEMYYDLDQRYQKTKEISAVDIDLFANKISNDSYVDELMDLVHKLRLSAETMNTLNSTQHAVIRILLNSGRTEELVNALDDRINYGLFLDYYTANILMDTFWKNKDFVSGVKVASQLMLQEEFDHPISRSLAKLHCFSYLLKPTEWPEIPKPPEPEEEVKVRVKFLRNAYFDDHFDIREPNKLIGKTLIACTKAKNDILNQSFNILGWVLFDTPDKLKQVIQEMKTKSVLKEVLDVIPENKLNEELKNVKAEEGNVQNLLEEEVKKSIQQAAETDITKQCELYLQWETVRQDALNQQIERVKTANRLQNIEDLKKAIKDKETKLWFFENEEKIELEIDAKKIYYPKRWFGHKKAPKKIDENYVPPEVGAKKV